MKTKEEEETKTPSSKIVSVLTSETEKKQKAAKAEMDKIASAMNKFN